jgi:hypothetical protein
VPSQFPARSDRAGNRLGYGRLKYLGCGLIASLAIAAHAGQTSAAITISIIRGSSPVSVVSSPSTVVVCGTATTTGATGCGVIAVPPAPGAGGSTPSAPGSSTGNSPGSGTAVPVVPTVVPPVVATVVPPVAAATAPEVIAATDGGPATVPPSSLPIARATLELVTLLRPERERAIQGSLRDPFVLGDTPSSRLEGWRARSVQVFSSASPERLANILGTSAEMRIIREAALDYTEMLVSW